MKSAAPTLLPLLRTSAQGEALALILLNPEQDFSVTEVASAIGVSPATAMREVDRFAAGGLITERRRGNTRLIRAATGTRLYRPLTEVMALTFGPVPVLRDALAGLPGVEEAFVYGSWAARFRGLPGRVPNDIDVMVIGSATFHEVCDALFDAERLLHREVNPRVDTRAVWDADNSSFKATVLSRPVVPLIERRPGQ
jgi:DNA-binding transcriptional ArsR family regulator